MKLRPAQLFKAGLALLVIAIALRIVGMEMRASRRFAEANLRVWFYSPPTKQLYAVPADTIPPEREGVRAVVVTFSTKDDDPKLRKIAYLETFTPELKDLLEKVHTARLAHKVYDGKIPARGSSYFDSNTLVRRSDDPQWHPVTTPEGHKILAEWRMWRGPNGERPIASVPRS